MSMTTATEGPFNRAARQINAAMEQMQKGYYGFYRNEAWTPSVNLYETDAAYLVCVDLAGVEKQKIEIEIAEQILYIRGARAVPSPVSSEPRTQDAPSTRLRVHLMEIDHGGFCREVELPVDVAGGALPDAIYRDGMLWITLPKRRENR